MQQQVVQSSAEENIRVLVADDSRIHTQLLAEALRRDRQLTVVDAATQSGNLVEAATIHNIDIAVISCSLNEQPLGGFDALRELRAARPDIRAVLLLDASNREAILSAFRAGARGVFSRHESVEILCKCIRKVHAGEIWADAAQLTYAVEALAASHTVRAVDAKGLNLLSKRELEVVHSLAEGLTNREIAERLGLSQHTIKNYLFRVFDKLGVSSRLELLFMTMSPGSGRQLAPQGLPDSTRESLTREGSTREVAARENGNGEGENLVWHEKAAEQGVPTAQLALAQMYATGKGATRDMVAAYMWCLISQKTAVSLTDEIGSAKDRIGELLRPDQMLEAEKKAAEWLLKSKASAPGALPPIGSRASSQYAKVTSA